MPAVELPRRSAHSAAAATAAGCGQRRAAPWPGAPAAQRVEAHPAWWGGHTWARHVGGEGGGVEGEGGGARMGFACGDSRMGHYAQPAMRLRSYWRACRADRAQERTRAPACCRLCPASPPFPACRAPCRSASVTSSGPSASGSRPSVPAPAAGRTRPGGPGEPPVADNPLGAAARAPSELGTDGSAGLAVVAAGEAPGAAAAGAAAAGPGAGRRPAARDCWPAGAPAGWPTSRCALRSCSASAPWAWLVGKGMYRGEGRAAQGSAVRGAKSERMRPPTPSTSPEALHTRPESPITCTCTGIVVTFAGAADSSRSRLRQVRRSGQKIHSHGLSCDML